MSREVLALAWPVMLSMGLGTLFTLVDAFWVGRLGPTALAAVAPAQFAAWVLWAIGAILETGNAADRIDLRVDQKSRVTTATSELARNIVKYAGSGQFSVNRIEDGERTGVQIVARDRGPGIADVPAALRDHYSTGGTLGLGLPGVKRLMDELEVDSKPGKGTTVTATLWDRAPTRPRRRVTRATTLPRCSRSPIRPA